MILFPYRFSDVQLLLLVLASSLISVTMALSHLSSDSFLILMPTTENEWVFVVYMFSMMTALLISDAYESRHKVMWLWKAGNIALLPWGFSLFALWHLWRHWRHRDIYKIIIP